MRRVALGLGVVAVVVLAVWWWRGRDASPGAGTSAAKTVATKKAPAATHDQVRPDPAKLQRASIAGTVTSDGKPIANAQVCATGSSHDLDPQLMRDPLCASTDASGHFAIGSVLPAKYVVSASAKPFRPATYHPDGDRKKKDVVVAAGQQVTGIDIELKAGGVELTGIVLDLTGGPIEKARVSATSNRSGDDGVATTETAADGTFSLWVAPGGTGVSASADGYAEEWEWSQAPGKIEMLLTPESSVAGVVVDAASGDPIEGARVSVGSDEWSNHVTFSDAKGAFRITRLVPSRYVAVARTDHGYGRSEGSTLVGLGQNVEGIVVKLHPAVRVDGRVVIAGSEKAPCDRPDVSISEGPRGRWLQMRSDSGGRVWAEGVLAGKYSVDVSCDGFRSKEKYEPLVVADKDLTAEWEVERGATVTGRVLQGSAPVENARIYARTVGGDARKQAGWASDRSKPDGTYTLEGLQAGTYKIEVQSDKAIGAKDGYKVEIADGATVKKDLVLEDSGTIQGVVVDSDGKPVSGIRIAARSLSGSGGWRDNDDRTDDSGAFTIEALRPGEYRVNAQRSWRSQLRKPGTTDDAEQGERVAVRANQTATVKLVVESSTGTIRGKVTDATGAPVSDAFISAARESDAAGAQKTNVNQTRWTWDEKPVLTAVDGTFTVAKLGPGTYTIRAHRRGGGEAIAEHVPIGGSATLQIKPTGSIAGTVRAGSTPPDEMAITIRDLATGFSRREKYFRTGGAFTIEDLPKGNFQLTASADVGQTQLEIALGEGEKKTGVVVELGALVTLTGRVVEAGSNKPVAGMRMTARPAMGGGGFGFTTSGEDRDFITDDAGKFTLRNVPRGKLSIRGMPASFQDSEYGTLGTVRTVEGSGTIDLGDLTVLRKRVKDGEPVGKLGINFAQAPPDSPPDARELKISFLDPAGPAAKTELKVGDVIVSVDGVDVRGANSMQWATLTRAPPGTKLSLGLARGATITVTLAAP